MIHIWFTNLSHKVKIKKSREDAADVVANVLSRSLTLDDEDVEIDIDVSESRIDDVGILLKYFSRLDNFCKKIAK